ncbi:MAG: hypothetical protein VE98_C0001G0240 [candidate division Kazan bacterium GW2011_GWA1_50_15]|uniref:Uncharacterized protein n=1 Tax=candidate division Kazan bacterium GW2011_GWA1_50_15 TaxID=1620412 RepID=A0A0G4BCA4_UNCK3|nr:MAG: hypothetical protein VE98_C0001G0240 [candidate division Kazan bacterium GW2011_GWA1_50_15]
MGWDTGRISRESFARKALFKEGRTVIHEQDPPTYR